MAALLTGVRHMKAIGFRAEPRGMNWAVVESAGEPVLVARDTWGAPKTFKEADALKALRARVLEIIAQYKPSRAVVRLPETVGKEGNKTSARQRSRVEGVVMEACASQGVEVVAGPLATIGSRMGTQSAKTYLSRDEVRNIEYPSKNVNVRESIVAAVAGLEK